MRDSRALASADMYAGTENTPLHNLLAKLLHVPTVTGQYLVMCGRAAQPCTCPASELEHMGAEPEQLIRT